MGAYFDSFSEDVRHERSLILLLSIVEPYILRQSKITDDEINIKKTSLFKKYTVKYA